MKLALPVYNLFAGAGLAFALAWFLSRVRRHLSRGVSERASLLMLAVIPCAALGAVFYDRAVGVGSGSLLPTRGLAFYGALLGGLAALAMGAWALKLPLVLLADCAAPAVPLGHAIGRLGCAFAGCCYGVPAPPDGVFRSLGFARVPIQLIEAAGLLGIAAAVALLPFPRAGDRFLGYVVGYGLLRSVLECFRGDVRGDLPGLAGFASPAQATALILVLGAGVIVLGRGRLAARKRPEPKRP